MCYKVDYVVKSDVFVLKKHRYGHNNIPYFAGTIMELSVRQQVNLKHLERLRLLTRLSPRLQLNIGLLVKQF